MARPTITPIKTADKSSSRPIITPVKPVENKTPVSDGKKLMMQQDIQRQINSFISFASFGKIKQTTTPQEIAQRPITSDQQQASKNSLPNVGFASQGVDISKLYDVENPIVNIKSAKKIVGLRDLSFEEWNQVKKTVAYQKSQLESGGRKISKELENGLTNYEIQQIKNNSNVDRSLIGNIKDIPSELANLPKYAGQEIRALPTNLGYLGAKAGQGVVSGLESLADAGGGILQIGSKALSEKINKNPLYRKIVSVISKDALDYKNWTPYQIGKQMSNDEIAKDLNNAIEKSIGSRIKSDGWKFAGEMTSVIANMLTTNKMGQWLFSYPGGATAGLEQVADKVSKLSKLKALATPGVKNIALTSFGSGYANAINNGATDEQATISATLSAIFNAAPETISGIGGVFGKGALDDIIRNNFGKVGQYLLGATGEGLEEIITAVTQPLADAVYTGKIDMPTFKELAKTFAFSFAVSSVVQGGQMSIDKIKSITNAKKELKQKNIDDAVIDKIISDIETNFNQPIEQPIQEKTNVTYKDGETYNLNEPKKVSMFKNFYRNIRSLFDAKTAKAITGDFDNAKLDYTRRNNKLANSLKKNIVDKYGIKKGSKDSALIQQYGEGIVTLDELKTKSSNWQNIVEADKYFREQYDILIDEINNTRKSIYPNVEATISEYERKLANVRDQIKLLSKQKNADSGKIANLKLKAKSYEDTLASDDLLRNKRVEKRKDYYRHFQEMAEGFAGLKNILTTSADISPQMVGVSDFTKPKTKFSSIAQRRLGNKTKYDAVGGFLNYIPTANYMISIDPQIAKLRTLTKNLREQMGEDTSANKAIEFLNEFTNQLAGKQNFLDRAVTKITGRKAIKGANRIGGIIKSNMILGNASSSISQVLNLPQIVGKIKNPKLLLEGFAKSYTNTDYSQSQFMSERYSSDIYSQFDTGLLKYPKKFAKWMLEALDERVTKTGWNAFYQEAINKNIDNPIQYADDNIRDLVAGRGIGEKTILQESNVINLIAPFTVEVGNLMGVLGDMAKKKEFMSLLITFIVSNLLNKGVKAIGGGGNTFDPIDALQDAFTEEDITLFERFGRIAGEVISNTPGGQVLASLYPKYGTKTLPTREQLFGDNDPTRFGTGTIFSKVIENPLTTVITPFGGSQIKKTVEGLKMFSKDIPGSYDKNGKLRFPISPTNLNKIQAAIFGQYASKEAREYFDKDRRALSEKQLDSLKGSDNIKRDYENIMKLREYNSLITKFKELQKAGKDTTEIEKQINDMFK